MEKNMPKVIDCNATVCAYNKNNQCHALAITVGHTDIPMCDTGYITKEKGGDAEAIGGVGACKVGICEYNNSFECKAQGIHVKLHTNHAECETFKRKK